MKLGDIAFPNKSGEADPLGPDGCAASTGQTARRRKSTHDDRRRRLEPHPRDPQFSRYGGVRRDLRVRRCFGPGMARRPVPSAARARIKDALPVCAPVVDLAPAADAGGARRCRIARPLRRQPLSEKRQWADHGEGRDRHGSVDQGRPRPRLRNGDPGRLVGRRLALIVLPGRGRGTVDCRDAGRRPGGFDAGRSRTGRRGHL